MLSVGAFFEVQSVRGEDQPQRYRYGVGAQWLLYGQRYSFLGITGRMEVTATRTVATLFEAGWASALEGDDDIALLAGAVIAYLDPSGERVYLGLGVGFARWEDRQGRDKGIWYQSYKKLTIGKDFAGTGFSLFFQASLLFDSWFNSIIVAGVYF